MSKSDDAISRQTAIEEIARWIGYIDEDMILRIQTGLKKLPSAQSERKTGHWIEIDDEIITGKCSVCGWDAIFAETDVTGMPYCPCCGARMDGGKEDEQI